MEPASFVGAVQQLTTLFHSADPAHSGLLSYSEFAYLILKSGGSQEQVDALIEQFSVPSRAQRMVCYAALLQQLSDSVRKDDDDASRGQHASLPRPADAADHSPLPVRPVAAAAAATEEELLYSLPSRSHDSRRGGSLSKAYASGSNGGSQHGVVATESYSLLGADPCTAGSRAGSYYSSSATATTALSRDTSAARYRTDGHVGEAGPRRSRSASGSPHTPFQPSSRFVASALRAAQQHGTPGHRRSSERRTTPVQGEQAAHDQQIRLGNDWDWCDDDSSCRRDSVNEALQGRSSAPGPSPLWVGQAQRPAEAAPLSHSPLREDSVRRMARAAKAAQRHQSRKSTASDENVQATRHTTRTFLLSSSSHNGGLLSKATPQHDSVLSSASTGSRATLLSLREVFQQCVLPASATAAERAGVVLLSELEDVFAAHGVAVHPLELEAVVDSLELQPDTTLLAERSRFEEAGVKGNEGEDCDARSAVNASAVASTGVHSSTTVTGGADCVLGLVDFCVLVSRLRPALIQRIRSPATWRSMRSGNAEDGEGVEARSGITAGATPTVMSRQGTRAAASHATPRPHRSDASSRPAGSGYDDRNGNERDTNEESDEPSIADVTVSPMTPPPTAGTTTPQSHRGPSPTSRRQRPQGVPMSQPSADAVDTRRPLVLRQLSRHDSQRGASSIFHLSRKDEDEEAPPTARQLSSDRQFSVLEDQAAATTAAAAVSSPQGIAQWNRYAQPTTSSKQRTRAYERRRPTASQFSSVRQRAEVRRTGAPVPRSKHRASPSPHAEAELDTVVPSRRFNSPPSPPRRVSVSVHNSPSPHTSANSHGSTRSPPSTQCSPSSPGCDVRRAVRRDTTVERRSRRNRSGRPSPCVLEALQSAAAAMLRCCTRLDRHHTGCLPRRAWAHVLRSSTPQMREAELQEAEAWIEQLCCRHNSTHGDLYAEVVEAILTEGGSGDVSPSSSTSRLQGKTTVSAAAAGGSPVTPSTIHSNSTTTTPAVSPFQRLSSPTTEQCNDSQQNSNERLRQAFLTACGGDTEALCAYLDAFDEAHRGYLHPYVWRASVEELFRRTMAQEVPAWVLDQCYQLSRRPFDHAGVQTKPQYGSAGRPVSAAEKAARVRALRIPSSEQNAWCDYRYVLQELGLDASLPQW